MDSSRKSTDSSESENVRRVAVEINSQFHLEKLNVNLQLEDILKQLCDSHGLIYEAEKYALTLKNALEKNLETAYVTEENKFDIKNGSELKLARSAKKTVQSFVKHLYDEDFNLRLDTLVKISQVSNDATILKLLNEKDILNIIIQYVEKKNVDMARWDHCYHVLENSLLKGFIEILPNPVIHRIMKLVSSDAPIPNTSIALSLRILIFHASKKNLKCPMGFLKDLLQHIRKSDYPDVQDAAIKLINYLFLYPNTEKEQKMVYDFVTNPETIKTISRDVLCRHLGKEIKHELYVYQTIILRKYTKRLRTLITENQDIFQKLERASQGEHEGKTNEEDTDFDDTPLKKALSKSLQSLTGTFSHVKTSFRRRRTLSTESQSSTTSQDGNKYDEFRNRSASVDREKRKKRPTFQTYLTESNLHYVGGNSNYSNLDFSTSIFHQRPISFNFYGDFNKDAVNWESNKKNRRVRSVPTTVGEKNQRNEEMKKRGNRSLLDVEKPKTPTPSPKLGKKSKTKIQIGKKRVSELTINNLFYFAYKYKSAYVKLYLKSEDKARSILYLGDNITRLLCDLFQIGNRFRIEQNSENFHPLCFHFFERFLEELFCITMTLFDKTRREMRVAVDTADYFVVFDIVRQQITQALQSRPNEFEELQKNLEVIPYPVMVKKREAYIAQQIKWELSNKPGFLELREYLKPDIMEMIWKQRRLFMEKGEHVPRVQLIGLKMQKTPEKGQFVKFNKHDYVIQFEDCDCSNPTCEHKVEKKVEIRDIEEVQIKGKSHLGNLVAISVRSERDVFLRQGAKQSNRTNDEILNELEIYPISLRKCDQSYVDFCSSSRLSMDYWYDGISMLIRKSMESSTMLQDLEDLLEIEMMSRYLEVEGLEIPDKPPEIPPPPFNYNFCTD